MTISTTMYISRAHFPVTTLGPGNRVCIWFQGCSIRCPGCISADTWAHGKGAISLDALLEAIRSWLLEADGITITGGEPFEQPIALVTLLKEIRRRSRPNFSVLVYTGFALDAVMATLEQASGLIDALITDPYEIKQSSSLALRGSDNQRLHLLTALGRAKFSSFERARSSQDFRLDVMFDRDGTVWLAGIPSRDDMRRLAALLAESGTILTTTQSDIPKRMRGD